MPMVVKTICQMCYFYCGLDVHVDDGAIVKIEGMKEHPVNHGRLCAKGLAAGQLVTDPQRLKVPMRRIGERGSGKWERITWDEALDEIATRLLAIRDQDGPERIGYYRGQAPGWVTNYNYVFRFMNTLRSPNVITHANLCFAPRAIAHSATYGGFPEPDYERANCIMLIGYNPVYTSPVNYAARIVRAKARGASLIVVDPRFTNTAAKADLFLQPRPGTDAALVLAMIQVIIAEGLYDREFVEQWTVGFDRLTEHVREKTPTWAEGITGVPAAKQLVTGTRFNVLSTLRGSGGGPSLAMNAHMDTVAIFQGEAQTGVHDAGAYRAWREEDRLFGLAVVNDRGCLATFLAAGKALKEAGVNLKGDLVLTAVVGEIGAAQIEEYRGPEFIGKGIGTRHAPAYGPHVDYALVAETTDFGISWVECGVAYIKVNVVGESIYTPRTRPKPGTPLAQDPNAIYRMARVLEAIHDWAATYPDRHALSTACGLVRPKVNIGGIRGGSPCRPSETAASCSIYLDVWQAPGMPLRVSLDELRQVLDESGVRASLEVYMTRNGFVAQGVEPLARPWPARTRGWRDGRCLPCPRTC